MAPNSTQIQKYSVDLLHSLSFDSNFGRNQISLEKYSTDDKADAALKLPSNSKWILGTSDSNCIKIAPQQAIQLCSSNRTFSKRRTSKSTFFKENRTIILSD